MFSLIVVICAALSVSGVVYAVSLMFAKDKTAVENRLLELTKHKAGRGSRLEQPANSVLAGSLDDVPNLVEQFLLKFLNIRRMLEQAGMEVPITKFLAISGIMGAGAAMAYLVISPIKSLAPLVAISFAFLPLAYVWFRRRMRMKRFGAQLPEALDLIGQALRAGQSLAAGIQLVAQQSAAPLGPEFNRCYEEQNLGVPMEQALMNMTQRIPNLDLKFFATSVVLQRQTGGDLAEILDKIAGLIRERFKIWGQIQALTGEGRLSGIVLLALPPALFLAMLKLNYEYVMMLFNEPLGRKMLIFGIIMQVFGAICIKKIITIKV